MSDYEVYTTGVSFSTFVNTILRGIGFKMAKKPIIKEGEFRVEEGKIIRTNKTKGEIERYYNRRLLEVLSITKCMKTKNQEVPII